MNQLQQHIEVMLGLLEHIGNDASTLVSYMKTSKDSPEAKLQVQERLKARMEENLKRIDITVARLRQSAMTLVSPSNSNPPL